MLEASKSLRMSERHRSRCRLRESMREEAKALRSEMVARVVVLSLAEGGGDGGWRK